mgnify:CR=1 FL=1
MTIPREETESDVSDTATVIAPDDGDPFRFGEIGGRFKISGSDTDNRFAVAQLPEIPPRTLAAPLHRHHNEDEYTYVLEGTLGTMAGGEVVTAEPGTWLVKPRGQWHTFWNAGDAPCLVIEIVSPAGFETYFDEVAAAGSDLERLAQINEKYVIDMDVDSVPELCEQFGLTFPEL